MPAGPGGPSSSHRTHSRHGVTSLMLKMSRSAGIRNPCGYNNRPARSRASSELTTTAPGPARGPDQPLRSGCLARPACAVARPAVPARWRSGNLRRKLRHGSSKAVIQVTQESTKLRRIYAAITQIFRSLYADFTQIYAVITQSLRNHYAAILLVTQ